MAYIRVLPRDLFNEADLLKCYGRLWLALEGLRGHCAKFEDEVATYFNIDQDPGSGALVVANLTFTIGGEPVTLMRPLNSREPWPLWVEPIAGEGFEPVRVFTETGDLSPEMLALIGAKRGS